MPLTASIVSLCDYLVAKFQTNAVALGVRSDDVYYGDQARLPRSPAICVEPGDKDRSLKSVSRLTLVAPVVYVFAYHLEVRSPQANRREADLFGEQIETLVHADRTMGGLVIHSLVNKVESGYANKEGLTLIRAARLTVEFTTQEQLS